MRKFFTIIFLAMFNTQLVSGMVANINNIKRSLNTAFGQPVTNDVYVITVTRTPTARDQRTQLISHAEFEELLKLLYGLCSNQVAPVYNSENIVLNGAPDCQRAAFSPRCANNVLQLMGHFRAFFIANNMQNNCKIIVFNEMFFSQEDPLTVAQKDFINRKLITLSTTTPNSIFFPNFLYTEARNTSGKSIHYHYNQMKNSKKRGIMAVDAAAFEDCHNAIKSVPNTADIINHTYLINETYSINNGLLLTKYKKASYFHESDTELSNGTLYEFGNGRNEKLPGVAGSLYAVILDNMTSEICFDLYCGIRKLNNWRNYKAGGQESLLHLIQSNAIDPFDNDPSNDNINRLPLNKCIIHADPYVNPYTKLSFVQDVSGRGRVIDCSNGDGILLLHSIVIGDSIYTITVCKI